MYFLSKSLASAFSSLPRLSLLWSSMSAGGVTAAPEAAMAFLRSAVVLVWALIISAANFFTSALVERFCAILAAATSYMSLIAALVTKSGALASLAGVGMVAAGWASGCWATSLPAALVATS